MTAIQLEHLKVIPAERLSTVMSAMNGDKPAQATVTLDEVDGLIPARDVRTFYHVNMNKVVVI